MKVLGIVTARGGSKGIPHKNIALLKDKPLLYYTAESALASRYLTKIILSTDDLGIAEVGREVGLEVPFIRPAALALDDTPTIPVLQHAVRFLESKGFIFDAVFVLQPTNPLRLTSDIDGAIELLEETGADSVISFSNVGEKHPARMKYINDNGRVIDPLFSEVFEGQPRQQLKEMFLRDGSVYVTRIKVLMDQNSLKGSDSRAWIIPPERACNIDSPLDLFIAECLLDYRSLSNKS